MKPRARPDVEWRAGVRRLIENGSFRADDGTRLACYETGAQDGTPLVLCGGLGGGLRVWHPLLERLGPRYRVLTWDYRGLYASGRPRRRAFELDDHVGDLLALLRHKQVEAQPVLVGWSMGVQVALELHRTHPELPRGFVGLFGTAGRALDSAFDSPFALRVVPGVLGVLRAVGTRFRELGPRLARAPGVAHAFVRASRALGLMGHGLDVDAFRDVAEDWTRLDLALYAAHFDALFRHDAWDLLPEIGTPSLLIGGGCDRFTPAHLAERIAKTLPRGDFELLPDATHFGLLEEPDAIAARIERFADERLGIPGRR